MELSIGLRCEVYHLLSGVQVSMDSSTWSHLITISVSWIYFFQNRGFVGKVSKTFCSTVSITTSASKHDKQWASHCCVLVGNAVLVLLGNAGPERTHMLWLDIRREVSRCDVM